MNSAALNKYFRENVQLAETESKKYRELTLPNIETILQYINEQDPRFSRQPIRAGSYWQGLKVDKADEYDISVVMNDVVPNMPMLCSALVPRYYGFRTPASRETDTLSQNLEVVKKDTQLPRVPEGYCFMNIEPCRWDQKDDLLRDAKHIAGVPSDGDLVPFLMKRKLKKLLTEAIEHPDITGDVKISQKAHGPALTVYFTSGTKEISVDFAPFVRSKWPFCTWLEWPRGGKWPSAEKVRKIEEIGFGAVAKKDFYWLFSFVEAEKELVNEIDADGGKRKELHRIMKMLNTDEWTTRKPAITSYMLKNLWWWEMEKFPTLGHWDNDSLWPRLESMTRELLECIQRRELKQYFCPSINLMNNRDVEALDKAAEKIQAFLSNPLRYIESPNAV